MVGSHSWRGKLSNRLSPMQEIKKKSTKTFRFTFTTNGMLLNDEITEFLNQEMHNVVLSLDGRKSS